VVREKHLLDWKKWKLVGLQGTEGVCCLPVRQEKEEGRMPSFALRSAWKSDPKYFFIAFLLTAGSIRVGRQ